jgi:hypothetical protein
MWLVTQSLVNPWRQQEPVDLIPVDRIRKLAFRVRYAILQSRPPEHSEHFVSRCQHQVHRTACCQ